MIVRTKWRMVAAQVTLWVVAVGAVAYFGQQAYVGDHGLLASRSMAGEIKQLRTRLDVVQAERAAIEHRIELLSNESIDPDLLDEQARTDLGWIGPNDRVLQRE